VQGDQPGEKFGSAATACDVTGDGLDDLIVGAPFYTPTNQVSASIVIYVANQSRLSHCAANERGGDYNNVKCAVLQHGANRRVSLETARTAGGHSKPKD
jgi:hypothetical protein